MNTVFESKKVPGLRCKVTDTGFVYGHKYGFDRPVKATVRPDGRLRVNVLAMDGTTRYKDVDKLVCEAFNGPPPRPRARVIHLDGDLTNNRASNLVWGD
ncbi:HNH endonuclease [Streptomyces sp. SDT5-1]|uniref:HNH endonuclease n=1 Tax=Streptomyces sp. SDT5-1 TaxID=3406418 RepID=UPI003FD4C1D0